MSAPGTGREAGPEGAANGERTRDPEPAPQIPGYELARRIGQGGYGKVWLARREAGNESAPAGWVALKVVARRSEGGDTKLFEQECRGVRAAAGLGHGHPGLVAVLDHGITADGEFLYYAMELADGAEEDGAEEDGGSRIEDGDPRLR